MTSLPATIRDAFIVFRQLGMRYIWIDALCILQEIIEYWERESAQMGHVHANAYCTIATSSTSHSDGGYSASAATWEMLWSIDRRI